MVPEFHDTNLDSGSQSGMTAATTEFSDTLFAHINSSQALTLSSPFFNRLADSCSSAEPFKIKLNQLYYSRGFPLILPHPYIDRILQVSRLTLLVHEIYLNSSFDIGWIIFPHRLFIRFIRRLLSRL